MPPLLLRLFLWLLLAVVGAASLTAQRVRWQPAGGTLAVRQTSELSLIFDDCEPRGDVTLPHVPNLTIGQPQRGEQSSFSIVNGQATRTRTVYLTYPVRPDDRVPITIPAFTVPTDQGPVQVAPVTFDVGTATVGGSSLPLEAVANSRVTLGERDSVWAGEVVPIDYTLSVASRFWSGQPGAPEWDYAPLVKEDWARPEPFSGVVNGEARTNVLYRSRGYFPRPGATVLSPVQQIVNLRLPGSPFNLFQAFQAEQFTLSSNAPSVTVRPLPPGAPDSFEGAVGAFDLASRVVPAQATVGEPVTWTLELTGTGNWPNIVGLPERDVSRDFRIVQPQAQRTPLEGRLFDATLTEDVVLIPTRAGTYTIGPVRWSYFDPATGAYRTVVTEAVTVTVNPAAPSGSTVGPGFAPVNPDEPPATAAEPRATAPAALAPDPIPRDPLTTGARGGRPLTRRGLLVVGALTLSWVPFLWLGLAWRRARRDDPDRPRRLARTRLTHTLATLRAGPREPAVTHRLLRRWQTDTMVLWRLPRTASGAGLEQDERWARLWAEADEALYRPDHDLPADWVARADAALAARPAPRFALRRLWRLSNFLPLVVAVAGFVGASALSARSPTAAYSAGDYVAAEAAWRDALRAEPGDWAARHNLALALAQQERWDEATAHALAAFVQHPRHASVRWHVDYLLPRAAYRPAVLHAFLDPDLAHRFARLLSPVGWQLVILVAGLGLALGFLTLLLQAYHGRRRAARMVAWSVGGAALLAAVLATFALRLYGPAADPRAVLVWHGGELRSIPTDAAIEQQTTALSPGSIALVDHTFLGWVRLAFANGQTGWIRREHVVPLWPERGATDAP